VSDTPRFKHLGEVVRYLRHASGLTRSELDIEAGLKPGTVQRIEEGTHFPTWPTFERLCAHPSMHALVATCERHGVELGARPPPKA
jgi:DNA-binding XRE family transcriptional regulator